MSKLEITTLRSPSFDWTIIVYTLTMTKALCRFSSISWLPILLILAYMAMVVVILLNILIAQLSYTYAEAKKTAKLQYAVDRMFIVSRLETSRFARFVWQLSGFLAYCVIITFS